jgi:hypothetical protein
MRNINIQMITKISRRKRTSGTLTNKRKIQANGTKYRTRVPTKKFVVIKR